MKRLLPVLVVIALVLVLAACSDNKEEDKTTSVSIASITGTTGITGRDITATAGEYTSKTAGELYWYYTATKADSGFNTGAVSELTPLKTTTDDEGNTVADTGIPSEEFGEFSYGKWNFRISAYYYETDEDGTETQVEFYSAQDNYVTLSSSNKTLSVNVTLTQSTGETGEICISGIKFYQKDVTVSDETEDFDISNVNGYLLYYVIDPDEGNVSEESFDPASYWEQDEDKEMLTDSGLLLEDISVGYHQLAIYLVLDYSIYDEETESTESEEETESTESEEVYTPDSYDIIASAYVSDSGVYVRAGAKSVVSGYIQEGLTTTVTISQITAEYTETDSDGEETTTSTVIYPASESE